MNYRAIFISDIHLGTRGCNSTRILDFLRNHESDTLYLVGDIIDGWALSRKIYWTPEHNTIVQKILRKVRKGTRVIYICGNHDEFLRDYLDTSFGGVEILDEIVHVGMDGKSYLVLHGDRFDYITMNYKWLSLLGDIVYNGLLNVHNFTSWLCRQMGLGHWSLSRYLKHHTKKIVNVIGNYEHALVDECRKRHYDGIICGHIHHPEISLINGIFYGNCGDGVESCTALVETHDGTFQLLEYMETPNKILMEYKTKS